MDYKPADFLARGQISSPGATSNPTSKSVGLLILNQPIPSENLLRLLWNNSSYHLCADGGANQLLDSSKTCSWYPIPDAIHGDLDSLSDEASSFYSSQGTRISKDASQESTDFGKAVQLLLSALQPDESGTRDVLILGSISGRVDQGLRVLHDMLCASRHNEGLRLWLFSETNVSFLLQEGKHRIETPLRVDAFGYHFGTVPIFGPAMISTQGLRWDVENWETKMGGQLSTNNHILGEVVHVVTDACVLVTIELGSEVAI